MYKRFKSEPDVTDEIGCREMSCRLILAAIMVGCAVSVSGCTMPQTVNFAPLVNLDVKDSANGNTVP